MEEDVSGGADGPAEREGVSPDPHGPEDALGGQHETVHEQAATGRANDSLARVTRGSRARDTWLNRTWLAREVGREP
eukprot:6203489-Prymnesium_polylepis.1